MTFSLRCSLFPAGSFTHWQKMPMLWRQVGAAGEWYKTVDLPPAIHQYKFIIDGQWRHDHTAPTVLDNLGNVNNCITVQAAPPVMPGSGGPPGTPSGKQRAGGSHGSPGSGGQVDRVNSGHDPGSRSGSDGRKVDVSRVTSDPYNLGGGQFPNDSYSQVVPPRDELLVHHSASLLLPPQLRLLLPHHHGDSTTMPLSVQMNHVFCHLNPDFSIFAIAHRYRDRSVTQLLYKPNGAVRRQIDQQAGGSPQGSGFDRPELARRGTEIRAHSVDVTLQSVRISGTQRQREGGHGNEYVTYLVDSILIVHGVQTMLRSERRYKHFNLLDQLLRKAFGPLVPQAMPAKRFFGLLQPAFVEERRVALEKYLQQCVAIPAIATSSLFCNFVEADLRTPGAARTPSGTASFEEGEELLNQSLHRVCTKQGHLLKKGRRRASWKRRYFCLCDSELFYYYTAEMSNPFQPLGVISMKERENQPKSDSLAALDNLDAQGGGGTTPPAQPPQLSPVIIQPLHSGDGVLPRLYSFAVHTSGRTWHLAADSAKERDDWVRVLCACGAQLSASSAEAATTPPKPPPAATAASAGGSGGGAAGAPADDAGEPPLQGMLWKRASKVHIAQPSEAETGQGRDWVSRHFSLLPGENSLVYKQNAGDPLTNVRGVVPLASYERVEPAPPPRDHLPFAFRLIAKGGNPDGSFVFAAPTESERDVWINQLSTALVEAAEAASKAAPTPELTRRFLPGGGSGSGQQGGAQQQGDALAGQLAASVSIS